MTLLSHVWQSTLCLGIAALVVLATRRTHARVRHAVWLAASAKFLLPFALVVAAGQAAGAWMVRSPALAGWLDRPLSFWTLDVAFGSRAGTGGPAADLGLTATAALAALWLAGVLAVGCWRWRQFRAVAAAAAVAPPLERGREADALERAIAAAAPGRPIRLVLCDGGWEPAVLGFFRPILLWPRGLSDRLTDPELDAIVAHEVSHVRRRDNLASLAHMVVETVFWFHPLVWWLGAQLVNEQERACDEEVLHMGADKRSYAEGMLKVCRFSLRVPVACVAGVGGASLSRRIERIMTWAQPLPLTGRARVLLASVAALVIAAPLATGILAAAVSQQKVYRIGNEGVKAPKLVYEVKPKYTEAAMREKIQGTVVLDVVILEDGNTGDITVVRSLDEVYGLDAQAVDAARQWRFEAGTKDGKAVPVLVQIEMAFALRRK